MTGGLPHRGSHLVAYFCVFIFCICCLPYFSFSTDAYNSFIYSSVNYPQTWLEPYGWRYIRVDLPRWFSTLSLSILSDVDHSSEMITKPPHSELPLLCLRTGGPPLPDLTNASFRSSGLSDLNKGNFGGLNAYENHERCYIMKKNITIKLTNYQISSSAWYIGFFNGIGPSRTQSKMISRGQKYSFRANISVEACAIPTMWGLYCNQTVEPLACSPYQGNNLTNIGLDPQWNNESMPTVIACGDALVNTCLVIGHSKVYSLEMVGIVRELSIASDAKIPYTNKTHEPIKNKLMCFARYGAIPSPTYYDNSVNLMDAPLIITSPKAGIWYIAIMPFDGASENVEELASSGEIVCYTVNWLILLCPLGRAGLNCTYESYMLQNFPSKEAASILESYYLPVSGKLPSLSSSFLLNPFLSRSSSVGEMDQSWTYFFFDVPRGAAGGNLHISLKSNRTSNYEIYVRFGGMASALEWDYFYSNSTSHSRNSILFEAYNSNSKEVIDCYIYYVFEGTWSFVIRFLNYTDRFLKDRTTMSISLERCPKKCSFHGTCQSAVDTSGLSLYSYCSCDRGHGGFDCSIEIISHRGRLLQSVFLIASNVASLLPSFWALRKKAFAEWVVFTCSGISSGLYHACDVGVWCVVSFHALQFMDFWLSFMAVVSTFVYLASINEASRRTIHTVASIITALMAASGATRSANVVLIMVIGALALLIGWAVEFISTRRLCTVSVDLHLTFREVWKSCRIWVRKAAKMALKRYTCSFIGVGIVMFVLAGISWGEETSESYWIWHSLWHVCIYTSSFFFLCSKVDQTNDGDEVARRSSHYELTRQDSLPRGHH